MRHRYKLPLSFRPGLRCILRCKNFMHPIVWPWEKRLSLLRFLAALLVFSFLLLGVHSAYAESSLQSIRNRGVLVIGTDATYPPFELKTGDNFEGFDIDFGNEIGKEMGVPVRWDNINWDGIFAALQTNKFDLVISDVVITDKRKKEMAFSRPYFLSGQTIVRRKEDGRIRSSKDLPGKLVTVQQETTGQYAVEKLGLPAQQIRKFETMQDALLEVRNGRGDAAVGDLPALREMIRKGYPELETVGGIFVHENYAVVARRGEPELLAAVNEAIGKIMADGRYAHIYEKWIREPLPANYLVGLDKVSSQGTPIAEGATGSSFTIRWSLLRSVLPLLLQGALMTLWITFLGLLIGIPTGLIVALGRLSPFRPLSLLAIVFVETVRGTPLLLQIFAIYFVLPSLGLSLPQFVAAVVALSLNSAAYIAEIFRAGIQSIDKGQMEAARAVGMNSRQALRWVILPQTLRRVLPPLTNEAVALLKDSSLISIIGLSELMRVGREQASNSGSPITIVLALALLYLLMTLPLTYLVRRLEARWEPISRPRVRGVRSRQATS
ncbi:glutamine transport system permease protein GlnP [Abditibacteriota bacterium]|nr:glutamine transport system permease protein GlnP [Abditibacteriota bacterium]